MNCPHCRTNLLRESRAGDAMLKTAGLIFKSDSLTAICPKCGNDVPFSQTLTKAVQERAILFFRNKS